MRPEPDALTLTTFQDEDSNQAAQCHRLCPAALTASHIWGHFPEALSAVPYVAPPFTAPPPILSKPSPENGVWVL